MELTQETLPLQLPASTEALPGALGVNASESPTTNTGLSRLAGPLQGLSSSEETANLGMASRLQVLLRVAGLRLRSCRKEWTVEPQEVQARSLNGRRKATKWGGGQPENNTGERGGSSFTGRHCPSYLPRGSTTRGIMPRSGQACLLIPYGYSAAKKALCTCSKAETCWR